MDSKRIILAAKALDAGSFYWDEDGRSVSIYHLVDTNLLGDFWAGISADRKKHRAEAEIHATRKLDYAPNSAALLPDDYEAWQLLADAAFARLETNAYELRLLALAAVIRPGEPECVGPAGRG